MGQAPLQPTPAPQDQEVRVINAPRAPFRDLYHHFLRIPWWAALGVIVVAFLLLNAVFATLYLLTGGVANARPGSFVDVFFFSVQTMGTIGYGAMYPLSPGANALMVAEAVIGLIVTAVATGLVFAKFSQSTARIVFAHDVTIAPVDGTPTLMFRIGNERGNQIIEATVRAVMFRTERTREGVLLYRMYDLPLARERTPALSRSWMAMHFITKESLLFGHTPESLAKDEVEIIVTVVGLDDTSLQPVYGRHLYTDQQIRWGARHADVLSEDAAGRLVLDVSRFHRIIETKPTADFPYPAERPARPQEGPAGAPERAA